MKSVQSRSAATATAASVLVSSTDMCDMNQEPWDGKREIKSRALDEILIDR